jgi:hypothetical protein
MQSLSNFSKQIARWRGLAQRAYNFVKESFPGGAKVRPDDVAKALFPLVEVNDALRDRLHESKLKQKYWISVLSG